ncbi:hypothetical protein Cgig2_008570 [Carnegiea gigantea]|uniref:Uncharacterized protein n=1 Tax=Carnegiea gigantea TaxID=171969 RepID=A0A9Q1GLH0_9CARY|nr:hypothetical protein Cgig2_008570 [Carnegiea gigantea]
MVNMTSISTPQHPVPDQIRTLLPKLPTILCLIYSKNPLVLQGHRHSGGLLNSSFCLLVVINSLDLCESLFPRDRYDYSQDSRQQATSIAALDKNPLNRGDLGANRWAISVNCSGSMAFWGLLNSSFLLLAVINSLDLCESLFPRDSYDYSQDSRQQATFIAALD